MRDKRLLLVQCLPCHTYCCGAAAAAPRLDLSNQRSFILSHSQTNPKYWDDADAEDVKDAYGEDWEKVAAFTYDGVDYTMVKILEPVLVLAKEDPVGTTYIYLLPCLCV